MHVMILGSRGIPAIHGGFETFAEDLSLYLVEKGHEVTVYCQVEGDGPISTDTWKGVRRVLIPAKDGPRGTIAFDWKGICHSSKQTGVVLTLGYNTALFNLLYRVRGVPCVMNMDGIEWHRQKWSWSRRQWLRLNEFLGARIASHLVADHPAIKVHLSRHTNPDKITMIPYGAEVPVSIDLEQLAPYKLEPNGYYLVIARPEPENSILQMVKAYSRRTRRFPLVILGKFDADSNAYHRSVKQAASSGVHFLGAIYDHTTVSALRLYCRAYLHGHTVGGTNPSLVESLAAGNAVIAHQNKYNKWVAGSSAQYFDSEDSAAQILDRIEEDPSVLPPMQMGSRKRYLEDFTQTKVLGTYEDLLLRFVGAEAGVEAKAESKAEAAQQPKPGAATIGHRY